MADEEFDKGEPITWDDIDFSGKYLKFEQNKKTLVLITDFGFFKREGKKYKSEDLEMQEWFDAKVLEIDGKQTDKIISVNSKPFLRATEILKELDSNVPVLISVKKLGDKSSTAYDIELIKE